MTQKNKQIEDVLKKVLDRTISGKLTWQTTVNPQAFLTVLGRQAVVISKQSGGIPDPEYKLEVRNSGGSTIAMLLSGEYSPTRQTPVQISKRRQMMEKLFERAQASAIDSGLRDLIEKLDELIEDLEKV